jgi:hypothetical protein
MDEDMSEEAQLARAIQMSMEEEAQQVSDGASHV